MYFVPNLQTGAQMFYFEIEIGWYCIMMYNRNGDGNTWDISEQFQVSARPTIPFSVVLKADDHNSLTYNF